MGNKYIEESIINSLDDILENDSFLLVNNVNEPTISHKLAQYLGRYFEGYDIDCEYNRNIESEDLRKKIYLMNGTTSGKIIGKDVIPDIIVHKRGTNSDNLCAIEIKKHTCAKRDIEYARTKLKTYTTNTNGNLDFDLGILITFITGKQGPDYEIEFYENGESID